MRTLPAVADLRAAYPEARISWLVERGAAGLLRGQPELDDVIVFPRESLSDALTSGRFVALARECAAFRKLLVDRRFDWVLDFHSIFKSGVLSKRTGAPHRVAFAPPFGREFGWIFANHRARMEGSRVSRHERNAALIRYLGLEHDLGRFRIHVDPSLRRQLAESLECASTLVLLHPGSSATAAYKRYGPKRLGAIARQISEEVGGVVRVICGPDPEEARLAREVVEVSEGHAHLAPETADLAALVALLERADLYIGGDSGPLHLAAALRTPVVQIFGPTDPIENRTLPGSLAAAVRVPVACSPCRRGCPDATCMKVIPCERVIEAACRLLASPRRATREVATSSREDAKLRRTEPSAPTPGVPAFGSR